MDCLRLKYPIYIISKGRWKAPLTARIFLQANIDFKIVIEPQELDDYKTTIPEKYIAVLPFSNLGMGSTPARNWCWEDSIKQGFEKHFIFDDNIRNFHRFVKGGKRPKTPPLEALECLIKLSDRFKNIAIAGYEYKWFITKAFKKPFKINYHVYSGLLITNKIPYRWRLKYNEDVDLCLQVLHDGWCTLSLYAFSIDKVSTTVKMKGGNQDELYKNNDPHKKMLKARSLEMIWPQYAKTVYKYDRPHHSVSWTKHFKHPLIKK